MTEKYSVDSGVTVCRKCGVGYGKLRGYFPVSYAQLYKGVGYMPYCKECVNKLFQSYYLECKDEKAAMHRVCRKLDLYWSESIYDNVAKSNATNSILTAYLTRVNSKTYAGKSYDDTLTEYGVTSEALLSIYHDGKKLEPEPSEKWQEPKEVLSPENDIEITPEIVAYWGPGYTEDMLRDLEQRRRYWLDNLPDGTTVDVGMEALIRQICNLEIDINRDRAAGKPVDKLSAQINSLVGSMKLKPAQKDDTDSSYDRTPMGVWIKRWEDQRPIPEVDESLQDVDHIGWYISVFFLGHLCKMLNLKTKYSRMYDEAMEKLRVERPEYDDEDEEEFLYDIFGDGGDLDGRE